MKTENLKSEIYDYLQTERLMSIATNGSDHIWIANVYYLVDRDLNLYFLSQKSREHSKHIAANPEVAVGIADSRQPFAPGQKGIQLYGEANLVNILSQLNWMAKFWNELIATDPSSDKLNAKDLLNNANSGVYKVTPKVIKYFNTDLWPKEQTKVLEL